MRRLRPTSLPPRGRSGGEQPDEIVVFGRNLELLGMADAASEGAVGGADLLVRPLLRVAELLEVVPGLIATQHSGSGKANQYFLRGFNLDHGTDFTTYVDGMPMNLRTHGHGQGYLDINGLIPELVERIDYRKGPYRADVGDFSMAGVVVHHDHRPTRRSRSSRSRAASTAGGASRAAARSRLGDGDAHGHGRAQDVRRAVGAAGEPEHTAVWGKYARPTGFGTLAITRRRAITRRGIPTEQIPERAIGTSACADAFCALDPTRPAATDRWITTRRLDGDKWRASAYAQYYDWQMQSDPTYDFQLNQFDRRWTTGGRYERTADRTMSLELNVGGDFRYDDIGNVGVDHWSQGRLVENISAERDQGNLARRLRRSDAGSRSTSCACSAGLRGDFYDFDVTAKNAHSFAGNENDSSRSPKIGVAYDAQRGRRALRQLGPRLPLERRARRREPRRRPVAGPRRRAPATKVGARFEVGALKLTAAYWWLDLDSELIFVGDSNAVEPKGASTAQRLRADRVLAAADLARHRRGLYRQPRALRRQPRRPVHRAGRRALGTSRHLDDRKKLGSERAAALSRRISAHARTTRTARARRPTSTSAARTRSARRRSMASS